MALFEVKGVREHGPLREAVTQLAQYKRIIGKAQLPTYLVFPPIKTSNAEFQITEVLEGDDTRDVYASEFPTYAAVASSDKAAVRVSQGTKIRSTVDQFKVECFVLAGLVGVLFLLDAFGKFSMSAQQLTLGGVIVLLILRPYVAKFKMLGVEFER